MSLSNFSRMTLVQWSFVFALWPLALGIRRHSDEFTATTHRTVIAKQSLWTRSPNDGCPQTGEEMATAASAADRDQRLASGQIHHWIADKSYTFDSVKTDMLEWSQSLFDNQQDSINNFVNFLQDADKGKPKNFAVSLLEWGEVIGALAGGPYVAPIFQAVRLIIAAVDALCKSAQDAQNKAGSFIDAAVLFRDNLSAQRANVKRAIDRFVADIRTKGADVAIIAAYNVTTRLVETLPSQRAMFNAYTSQYLNGFSFIMQRQMAKISSRDSKEITFFNEPLGIKAEMIWTRLMDINPGGCLSLARFPIAWWVSSDQGDDVYWNCAELPFSDGGAIWFNHCHERDGDQCQTTPVIPDGAKEWCQVFQHKLGEFQCETDHWMRGERFRC